MSEFEVQETPPEGAPDWIVTFADLMSLLLTFFVLLLSFSNMEVVKFRTMAGSVRNALGLKSEFDLAEIPMGNKLLPYEDPKEGEGDPAVDVQALRNELEAMLRDADVPQKASVRITSRGVALYIEGDILFDSGSTALRREARPLLDRLAEVVPRVGYRVDVQGHSDSIPISTTAFPSNWELSAARAGRAVRYLVEQGAPADRFRAIGLADTHPVDTNDTAKGRAANRRVEFLFVNPQPPQPAAAFMPQVAAPDTSEAGAAGSQDAAESSENNSPQPESPQPESKVETGDPRTTGSSEEPVSSNDDSQTTVNNP